MFASLFLLAALCEFWAHQSGVLAASEIRGRTVTRISTAGIDPNSSSMGRGSFEVAGMNMDSSITASYGGPVLLNEVARRSREGYRIAADSKNLRRFLVLFSGHQGTTYALL